MISFSSIYKKLPFLFILIIFSCKKDSHLIGEKIDPKQELLNLEYQKRPKVQQIRYIDFLNKVDLGALGEFKDQFVKNRSKEKLMSLSIPQSYKGLTINTDSVKMIVHGNRTSFIFQVQLSSPHAVSFQNLTIDQSEDSTFIFVSTYTPSKSWVAKWRAHQEQVYDGEVEHTMLSIDGKAVSESISLASTLKSHKQASLGPPEKISLTQVCTTYSVYSHVSFPCYSGMHLPGEACDYAGTALAAGYTTVLTTTTECEFINGGGGGTGGGSGGNPGTTPDPNEDFDPCDGLMGGAGASFERGTRLQLVPPPCDNGGPVTLAPVEFLVANIGLNPEEKRILVRNPGFVDPMLSFLSQNLYSQDSKAFCKWYLNNAEASPDFTPAKFINDYIVPNIFSDLANPPGTVIEGPVIDNGTILADLGDAPSLGGRLIGATPPRTDTGEDLTYGTNGNTNGVMPSIFQYSDAQLFNKMRVLFNLTTILDADMAVAAHDFIHAFNQSNVNTFGHINLSRKVQASSVYKNWVKRFTSLLNTNLQQVNGDINNVQSITINNRLKFDELLHRYNGLQILINDTESNKITLEDYSKNGNHWSAIINVEIVDHFGLDKHDVILYQYKHEGFAAWWTLQHVRGYKPFRTVINLKQRIEGDL